MRSSNTTTQCLLLLCSIFYSGAHSLPLPRVRVTAIPATPTAPKTSDMPTKHIIAIVCASLGALLLLSSLAYAGYILSRKKKDDEDKPVQWEAGMQRRPTLAAFTFGPRRESVFRELVRRATGMEVTNGEEGRELLSEKAEMGEVSPLTTGGFEALGGAGEKEKA